MTMVMRVTLLEVRMKQPNGSVLTNMMVMMMTTHSIHAKQVDAQPERADQQQLIRRHFRRVQSRELSRKSSAIDEIHTFVVQLRKQ